MISRLRSSIFARVNFIFLTILLLSSCHGVSSSSSEDPSLTYVMFAVIGDYGAEGTNEEAVADLVKSWSPDFIITTGDNNYCCGEESTIDANIGQYYHEFIYPYVGSYGQGAAENRFFPSLGNHDWIQTGANPYMGYFVLPGNERYYTFTWGPIQFFALDSDINEPDGVSTTSIQAQWLMEQLASSQKPFKFVYMHHPPYSSGLHGSNVYMQWPFGEWGADVVFSGHDHTYERIIAEGILYIVNGLGGKSIYSFFDVVKGSQFRYNDSYGALLIQVGGNHATFEFYDINGALVDSYSLSK